ncbi:MAG: YfhO family protein [Microgenomates group bacterium]|nr:YfhO family protein [Microgenomates group bacterium]
MKKINRFKILIGLVLILLIDIFLLRNLFYPEKKLFVTPEFYGGDFFTVELPLQKINCQYTKKNQIPFWSKDISFGYPVFAEGQIGFFNPINFLTCKFFDYKEAFKLQFLLHLYLGQIGAFFLANYFGLTLLSSVFFSLLFYFSPFLIMNWMHTTMIYPFSYLPWIFYFFLLFINKKKLVFYYFYILSIFLQFLCAHSQSFFISGVFILIIFLIYLKRDKTYFRLIFLLFFGYLIAILLGGFQFFPLLELTEVSNRKVNYSMAAVYDQNFTLKNLLTVIYPKIFGWINNGSYQFFKGPDPWEGILFIYYSGLFFLLVGLINYKNKLIKAVILSLFIFFLLALGKNSPIYLVHYLPFFSSFRFPTRYLFIVIFLLSLFSAYGLSFFIKKLKKNLIGILAIIVLILEVNKFINDFHIFYPQKKLYEKSFSSDFINKGRYFIPYSTVNYLDQIYIKKGYQKKDFYYQYANNFLLGNISAIYNLQSFNNKFGPQLRRYLYYYGMINENFDKKKKNISFDEISLNLINLAGIDHILTVYPIKNSQFSLVAKKYFKDYQIFIYKNTKSFQRVQFFDNYQVAETFFDFKKILENKNINFVILEKDDRWQFKQNEKIEAKYQIIRDEDNIFEMRTKTNKDVFLVLADNYYSGWKVYIDSRPKKLYQANLLYRSVYLPKGEHSIIFKYQPESFYFGLKVSLAVFFLSFIIYNSLRGWFS